MNHRISSRLISIADVGSSQLILEHKRSRRFNPPSIGPVLIVSISGILSLLMS